jgi:hypothetical protein
MVNVRRDDKLLPENTNGEVESGDDVLVIGYPRGFYIQTDLYPIVRSCCIASKWGSNFDGYPYFIIDRKSYQGSSGSLVISKPTNLVISKGKLQPHEIKQFVFLGVYSGQPTPKYLGTDNGYVWYGNIIRNIIKGRD